MLENRFRRIIILPMYYRIVTCLTSGLMAVVFCASVDAQTWGESLFRVKNHDFGRVAIGADAVYRFEIENVYEEDIRILGVHSSCGCTIPSVSTRRLKSEEKGEIVARYNTNGQHTREKSATLTVDLETTVDGQTIRDTVLLTVTGYIRPDVVLTPGIVEFGSVREGQPVARTIQLDYAGRSDWALTKIERSNPYVHAKAEEVKRSGGEVAYQITVTLKKDAPVGYVKDVLRFRTNEKNGQNTASEIVLPIQGMVMAPIHAKPSPFMVGILSPGESVSKNIVVRSDTPFRIMDVTTTDKRFRFTFSEEESSIQLVSVLFSAKNSETDKPRTISDEIRIRTNLPDQEFVTLQAKALLAPPDFMTRSETMSPKTETVVLPAIIEAPAPIVVTKKMPDDFSPPDFVPVATVPRAEQTATQSAAEPFVTRSSSRAKFGSPKSQAVTEPASPKVASQKELAFPD